MIFLRIIVCVFFLLFPLWAEEQDENNLSRTQVIRNWQQYNAPVIFGKVLKLPRPDIPFIRNDGELPSKLLILRVELSTNKDVRVGTIVLLEMPTDIQTEAGAIPSSYWIVNVNFKNPIPPYFLNEEGNIIYVPADLTYVWNGNILKKCPTHLHGIWKEMLKKVEQEETILLNP